MDRKIAVILGATRGIGRGLVKTISMQWSGDGLVYLTARNDADGAKTVSALRQEGVDADYLLFDLSDATAPQRVAAILKDRHGGVDIVVQNGAYMPRAGVSASVDARLMIEANSHGTLRVLRGFLPILRENGRLIVVASGFGVLKSLPEHLRQRFDTRSGDPDAINAAMDAYVVAAEAGMATEEGWPEWVNIPSKVGQVAVTRAFARQVLQNGMLPKGALINAACPGTTLTDATREFMGTVFKPEDAQTPEDAAASLAWLATLPAGVAEPYGELVKWKKMIPFGD